MTLEPDLLVVDVSGVDGADGRDGASYANGSAARADTTGGAAATRPNRSAGEQAGDIELVVAARQRRGRICRTGGAEGRARPTARGDPPATRVRRTWVAFDWLPTAAKADTADAAETARRAAKATMVPMPHSYSSGSDGGRAVVAAMEATARAARRVATAGTSSCKSMAAIPIC